MCMDGILVGQQYANARPTRRSMFAMKPEIEIWPCAYCFRFVGESACLSMLFEKFVRISSETAEIQRVKLGTSAQSGMARKISKSSRFSQKIRKKICHDKLCPNVLKWSETRKKTCSYGTLISMDLADFSTVPNLRDIARSSKFDHLWRGRFLSQTLDFWPLSRHTGILWIPEV